jgi:hypothetical protein
VSTAADPARQEDVIRRLRELHGAANDEDRPRAALLLGLAVADLVDLLPDDNPRRGDLAAEGLARLEESADASSATARARELLRDRLKVRAQADAAAGERHPEPGSFPLGVGDLNLDLDWEALRGPSEAARNVIGMLPVMASMLPPQTPLREALTSITEVIGAFEQGQWTPEGDAALTTAIEQVERGGLGHGLGLILRVVAVMVRVRRCQQVYKAGGQPHWPAPDELDTLIAELESSQDLAASLGVPFQAMDGLHHLYTTFVIMMRLLVDVRSGDVRRDASWRDRMLELIGQADSHLGETPPAYSGVARSLRGKLAETSAQLRRATVPPAAPPRTPVPSPSRAAEPTASRVPPDTRPAPKSTFPLDGTASDAENVWSWSFDPAIIQRSQQLLAGLPILAGQAEGPLGTRLAGMLLAMEAVNSRKWTPEHDERLAQLERQAVHSSAQPGPPQERAVNAALLAVTRAVRCQQRSVSPRSEEHPSADDYTAAIAESESALELLMQAAGGGGSLADGLTAMVRAQTAMLLVDLSRIDAEHRPDLLARARGYFDQLPQAMLEGMPVLRDMSVLEQLLEGRIQPDSEAVRPIIDRNPGMWDLSGGDIRRALRFADRAQRSRTVDDIGTALGELQAVWIGLPAGSPMRAQVLLSIATMRGQLAGQITHETSAAEAASTAVEALRLANAPDEVDGAARLLVTMFSLMLSQGRRQGPFPEAEKAVRAALTSGAGDWGQRVTLLTALAAATALQARTADDEEMRAASQRAMADAERALPAPMPTGRWYAAARVLFTWAAVHGLFLDDAESVRTALRLMDVLEDVLARHPEVTGQASEPGHGQAAVGEVESLKQLRSQLVAARARHMPEPPAAASAAGSADNAEADSDPALTTQDPRLAARLALERADRILTGNRQEHSARRPLDADGRPEPESLRSVAADLHAALAGIAGDTRIRQQVDRMLGICHAELYWADHAERTDKTLREAVAHLNGALMAGEHDLPTVEWAVMLDVLARCLREARRRHDDAQLPGTAERTARAALRELARCVMIAEGTDRALDIAARANEIVARAIGWSLADGQPRAAVDIAEAGRGLVLASVVLSGRVEAVLQGAGKDDDAEAWRSGNEADRAAALNALWDTAAGDSLLSTPIGEEISVTLIGTPFDAVVYLVPSAPADFAAVADPAPDGTAAGPGDARPSELTGHALLVRPVLGQIDVVSLPGLGSPGSGTPLDMYLAALERALSGDDSLAGDAEGFRSGPAGQSWAAELERLGQWSYAAILAPLLEHIRGWSLDHRPHLALIPLGDLAVIPFAASWTDDAPDGSRRYVIDDAVISYAASARLLGEVSRRPRLPLSERVVLMSSPLGDLPMTRRATRQLGRGQYPGAEVYGLKSDPGGPVTSSALLGALPAGDHAGASLLQLSTHGTLAPAPALRVKDGWLPLSSILDQARNRPFDAPGGLVIINACLTDTAHSHYDESLTMATAFLAAGATAVIGTRWPVDDDTAAALSLRLHYHLQRGYQPAEALRRAQLDLLRPTADIRAALGPDLAALTDARLRHPATWAGHVHHGMNIRHAQERTANVTDARVPDGEPNDPLSRALAEHWDEIRALADPQQRQRLADLIDGTAESDPAEARAALADELLDLLPPDHPVIRALRTRPMFSGGAGVSLRRGAWLGGRLPAGASTASDAGTVPVTIYLSDAEIHDEVEGAVESLLATAGLRIAHRDAPVRGSWFRRMVARAQAAGSHPWAYDAALAAAHALDSRLVLAQDAEVTAKLLSNVPGVLGSLQPTKDAVIRAGALLIVKVDWTVSVFQLTAAQQARLDHQPGLASSPAEIIAALSLDLADSAGVTARRPSIDPPMA